MIRSILHPRRAGQSYKLVGGLLLAVVLALLASLTRTSESFAAGTLTVEILASYNLVVDSNVETPATYAPEVATVGGRYCNTGDAALTDVRAYIGNYDPATPASSTPGVYPSRDSSQGAFQSEHPHLANSGTYSFTHVGGSAGTDDASRFLGTLEPGECEVQYWHFTYPRRGNPNNTGDAVWGLTRDPNDDLRLEFDMWGASTEGASANATWQARMRNEISAMANKIYPNGASWTVISDNAIPTPGELVTLRGEGFRLGVPNKGFDNDGDYVFDYNAWLQPVGDKGFDPTCLRLVHVEGELTIRRTGGTPDTIIPFTDQLFFTNLPVDNSGGSGNIDYTFMVMDGPCSTAPTPYQEVASGADNEKFNGDYGVALPKIVSSAPQVTLDKSASVTTVAAGGTVAYSLSFSNNSAVPAGKPDYNTPLVVSDAIPAGMNYVSGSASISFPAASVGSFVLYSTDNGATWKSTEPTPASNVTTLQWWLTDPLPGNKSGTASFSVTADSPYTGALFIENTGELSFGGGAPFAEDSVTVMIQGTNTIGDLVWADTDGDRTKDASESGLANITVELYWDENDNGTLDSGEPLIATTSSDGSGAYSFTNLPNADYLVVADSDDPQLPVGYSATTTNPLRVRDLGTASPSPYTTADFGFGPALALDKTQTSANPAYEGETVTYSIALTNLRPGNGTAQTVSCPTTYTAWAAAEDATHTGSGSSNAWQNRPNAFGASGPNSTYANSPYTNAVDVIAGTTYGLANYGTTITKVEALFSIYLSGTMTNDDADAKLYFNDAQQGTTKTFLTSELNAFAGQSTQGLLVWDVTSARTWNWTDFAGNLDLELNATKTRASSDGITIYLDAMGFRVTTTEICGGAEEAIATLPLVDTYDATKLEFVSASPTPNSTSAGTLSWDNLGPLYGGGTKTVTVTFKALQPANSDADAEPDPTTLTNSAASTGATFGDGSAVNDASDSVSGTLNPAGQVGDYLWNDLDGDRAQDAGEAGIPGVTVELRNSSNTVIATDVTDVNGFYLFEGVRGNTATSYSVTVLTSTVPNFAGATHTKDRDSGAANGNNNSGTFSINYADGVTTSDDVLDADFGYRWATPIVRGSVWHDWNRNGATSPDTGEEGIGSVTVVAYTNNGSCTPGVDCASAGSTTTDSSGNFTLTGLSVGNYYIFVSASTLPVGSWTQSFDTDSTSSAHFVALTLVAGQMGRADYSYYKTVVNQNLGDTVYVDWNGDGDQDTGEEGIAGVTVRLYEDANGGGSVDAATDALIATTTTDSNGVYSFANLPSASFIVQLDTNTLSGYSQTQDGDPTGVCTTCDAQDGVTLTGSSFLGMDFGFKPFGIGTIGDLVWNDADRDGLYDASEAGIASITVSLYQDGDGDGEKDGDDALIATTSTDSSGLYSFGNLPAGDYLVQVDEGDAQLPTDGSNPYVRSSASNPIAITLGAGESNLTADFGFAIGAIIGDKVYFDTNSNGLAGTEEAGIANVTLFLYSDPNGDGSAADGILLDTQVTDASGLYRFTGLGAGDYVVLVDSSDSELTGFTLTGDPDGDLPCGTCNAETAVEVKAGQTFLGADFGYLPSGIIGDTIWLDADDDGVFEAGESGLAGVEVLLKQGATTLRTTYTDEEGYYTFSDVDDGSYTVVVTASTLPSGVVQSYDPDATLDHQAAVTITGAVSNITRDFGYRYSGAHSISGTIFFDAGNDGGLYASGTDTPYGGQTVYLWRAGLLIGTTTTNAAGLYSFTELPDGSYTISVNESSPTLSGLDRTVPGSNARAVTISGSSVADQDFGFYSELDFGDLPTVYSTTAGTISYQTTELKHEGPRHAVGSLKLGNAVGDEPDGKPNNDATGDSGDDGVTPVTMESWSEGQDGGTLDLDTTGGTGYASGWVDWNRDGDFKDAGERILLDEEVAGSKPGVSFDIPAGTPLNTVYFARFRLFSARQANAASPEGFASNGEVEDYQWNFTSAAVDLTSFTATPAAGGMVVAWESASEIDNLGYNLYRSVTPSAMGERLNSELIASQAPGSATGFEYEWVDETVVAGTTYYYWLEGVSLTGSSTVHGPVSASLAAAPTTVAYRYRWTTGERASGTWTLAADGTFTDSQGRTGIWRYVAGQQRLLVRYGAGQMCGAFFSGRVSGSAVQGLVRCTNGSSLNGQWGGTLSGALAPTAR